MIILQNRLEAVSKSGGPWYFIPKVCNLLRGDRNYFRRLADGGNDGAIRPLPRDRGGEKLREDPTVGPHFKVWTKDQSSVF